MSLLEIKYQTWTSISQRGPKIGEKKIVVLGSKNNPNDFSKKPTKCSRCITFLTADRHPEMKLKRDSWNMRIVWFAKWFLGCSSHAFDIYSLPNGPEHSAQSNIWWAFLKASAHFRSSPFRDAVENKGLLLGHQSTSLHPGDTENINCCSSFVVWFWFVLLLFPQN